MTTETGHTAAVHEALVEVVALHAVLMSGAICRIGKGCFTQFVVFQFPKVLEVGSLMKSCRPIVVTAFNRVFEGLSLGMTLDAGIVCANKVQPGRIDDCRRARLR